MTISASICPLCMMDTEFGDHLFLHCAYSIRIWNTQKSSLAPSYNADINGGSGLSVGVWGER